MLQTTKFTAFIVSELLRENQKRGNYCHPRSTQVKVKLENRNYKELGYKSSVCIDRIFKNFCGKKLVNSQ